MSQTPPTADQIAADKTILAQYDGITGNKHTQRGGLAGFIFLGLFVMFICFAITFAIENANYGDDNHLGFWEVVFFFGGIAACGCTIHFGGIVKMQEIYDAEVAKKQAAFKAANDWDAIQSRKSRFSDLYK